MKDQKFEYQLLARLQMDCEYYLGNGAGKAKHLWALNVKDQIAKMKELWEVLEEKPHWITWTEILDYEERMTGICHE